jgi:hypothetical protein
MATAAFQQTALPFPSSLDHARALVKARGSEAAKASQNGAPPRQVVLGTKAKAPNGMGDAHAQLRSGRQLSSLLKLN